jgi:hypothetical protein
LFFVESPLDVRMSECPYRNGFRDICFHGTNGRKNHFQQSGKADCKIKFYIKNLFSCFSFFFDRAVWLFLGHVQGQGGTAVTRELVNMTQKADESDFEP